MNEPKQYNVDIGHRIKQARKAAKLTQEQLAEAIDVSAQYVSDLERGVVGTSIPTLIKICDTLAVSADYILRGRDSETMPPLGLSDRLRNLSPQEQALMMEGFNLLNKALSMK
ncbi:MAG: helix-turn-helix transcriptional regulator [Lachnospiraceae bacterium]|nr:helix-turn-helix transcriptional regulator [Lachnospiraceae bacterium]